MMNELLIKAEVEVWFAAISFQLLDWNWIKQTECLQFSLNSNQSSTTTEWNWAANSNGISN